MTMRRLLAATLVVFAAGREAVAVDCNCPPIQALAANPQISYYQVADRFNLAVLADGDMRSWGLPCPWLFPTAPRNVASVAAGYNHALVLHTDGTLEQFRGPGSGMPGVPAIAQTGV